MIDVAPAEIASAAGSYGKINAQRPKDILELIRDATDWLTKAPSLVWRAPDHFSHDVDDVPRVLRRPWRLDPALASDGPGEQPSRFSELIASLASSKPSYSDDGGFDRDAVSRFDPRFATFTRSIPAESRTGCYRCAATRAARLRRPSLSADDHAVMLQHLLHGLLTILRSVMVLLLAALSRVTDVRVLRVAVIATYLRFGYRDDEPPRDNALLPHRDRWSAEMVPALS